MADPLLYIKLFSFINHQLLLYMVLSVSTLSCCRPLVIKAGISLLGNSDSILLMCLVELYLLNNSMLFDRKRCHTFLTSHRCVQEVFVHISEIKVALFLSAEAEQQLYIRFLSFHCYAKPLVLQFNSTL